MNAKVQPENFEKFDWGGELAGSMVGTYPRFRCDFVVDAMLLTDH
jgi:hypothetical protein